MRRFYRGTNDGRFVLAPLWRFPLDAISVLRRRWKHGI